jgi:hypothetical protein
VTAEIFERCPSCGRVMSQRERDEQGVCDECECYRDEIGYEGER